MSLEDLYNQVRDDPDKRAKFFKIVWISSYFMLILGAVIIVAIILMQTV